ncbi:MAG TPA: CHAT domain-containing protein [Bacteroidetes bacterium]|nr:CHAT domain-containing protein [Bacteroidota bacterium]
MEGHKKNDSTVYCSTSAARSGRFSSMPYVFLFFVLSLNCEIVSANNIPECEELIKTAKTLAPGPLSIFKKQIALDCNIENDLSTYLCFYKKWGAYLRDEKKQPIKAIENYKEYLRGMPRPPSSEEEWKDHGWLLANIGYTYVVELSDLDNGLLFYQKAEDIFVDTLNQRNGQTALYIYTPIGNIYTRLAEYEKATIILEKARDILLEAGKHDQAARVMMNLGILYRSDGKAEKAQRVLEKGILLKGVSNLTKIKLLIELGLSHSYKENFKLAAQKTDQAFLLLNNPDNEINENEKNKIRISVYENYGEIYKQQKLPGKAYAQYLKAIALDSTVYGNSNRRGVAKSYIALGNIKREQGDYQAALVHYQNALEKVLPKCKLRGLSNPDASFFYAENTIAEALKEKALVLERLGNGGDETEFLQTALECLEGYLAVWKLLRDDFEYKKSGFSVLRKNRSVIEKAIQLSIKAWQLNGDNIYLEKAFNFSQQAKNLLLLEALQKAEATIAAGVPDSLINKNHDLNIKITWLEKQLLATKNNAENIAGEKIKKLETQLFETKEALSKLDEKLETEYPEYANRKKEIPVAGIKTLQNKLPPDAMLLDYFTGDSSIYVFKISKDNFEAITITKNFPLEKTVEELRSGLYDWQYGKDYNACANLYTATAHELYNKLIAPLGGLPEQLIIIPDGVLGYIPFEVLLKEKPAAAVYFKDLNYFGFEKTISYNYSAALWLQMAKREHTGKDILAMAPQFGTTNNINKPIAERRGGLSGLVHNKDEIDAIYNIAGGTKFSGKNATKENFLQLAGQYNILHLATHAILDDRENGLSYIAFAGASEKLDTGKIYLLDLYNLRLPADMVVLSACETGIGELKKGEGIISLARGFAYAGAKSIVTSLWEVNDKATAEIMEEFYRQLKKGNTKAEAMQYAKSDYFDRQIDDKYVHPYYWASFIAVGDMSAVELGGGFNWWWVLVAALLLLAIYVKIKRS